MRSVLFIDAGAAFGGAQRSLRSLLVELRKYEVDPHVSTNCKELAAILNGIATGGDPLPAGIWQRNLKGVMQAAGDIIRFRSWLRKRCDEVEPELIYANGIQAGLLVALAGLPDIKVVFHHRDCRFPGAALRKVVRRADRTIVLSDFMQRQCRDLVGPQLASRLAVVPNGFDFVELRQQGKADPPFAVPEGRLVVSLVADMVRWKRHDLFLRAVAVLAESRDDVHALLIGGPRDDVGRKWETELKRLAGDLGIRNQVQFCGKVDNALPLMRASDVVCSVAENEPFGRTVVEAAAMKCALVVTTEGGPEEIIRGLDNAVAVEADPEAVAEGVLAVVGQRVEPAPEWMYRYSSEQHAERILEIMSETS